MRLFSLKCVKKKIYISYRLNENSIILKRLKNNIISYGPNKNNIFIRMITIGRESVGYNLYSYIST